ncbi:hypothetical protein [Streptomyces sp. CBMA156]|uniref:hypothetical protein n=1 Tax=Streptomyces sp. CBMA156 TaxID=1930280 RepID=UPI001661F397|nr:hypothetical protein [Streptomyces sp. CBMA156]MBD0673120.1 hypothetical protein [Streptomyces sp. CBMA156]
MTVDLLLRIWSLRHPALSPPGPRAAARAHVLGSLAELAPHYRAGLALALRLVPLALLLLTGRRPATAPPAALLAGLRRVERLPLLGRAVRTTETLALYSGLDAAATTPRRTGPDTGGFHLAGDDPPRHYLQAPRTAGRAVSR